MTVNVHLHAIAPENISVLRDPVPGQRPYITLRIGEASIFLSPENERRLIAALTGGYQKDMAELEKAEVVCGE